MRAVGVTLFTRRIVRNAHSLAPTHGAEGAIPRRCSVATGRVTRPVAVFLEIWFTVARIHSEIGGI